MRRQLTLLSSVLTISVAHHADEADAQKKGSNNYQVLDNILGSPNETTAKLRFPMTASAFHLEIADVQRPLAFVMGDPTMVNWGLQQVLPLIPPKYEPGEHSKHTDWYFRAKLSKLPCEVCSTLMVLSYQSPVEIKMYEAYSGNSNYAHWMDRGHLDSVKDQGPPESSSSRPIVVKPAVEEWTELHLVQTTIDEGKESTVHAAEPIGNMHTVAAVRVKYNRCVNMYQVYGLWPFHQTFQAAWTGKAGRGIAALSNLYPNIMPAMDLNSLRQQLTSPSPESATSTRSPD